MDELTCPHCLQRLQLGLFTCDPLEVSFRGWSGTDIGSSERYPLVILQTPEQVTKWLHEVGLATQKCTHTNMTVPDADVLDMEGVRVSDVIPILISLLSDPLEEDKLSRDIEREGVVSGVVIEWFGINPDNCNRAVNCEDVTFLAVDTYVHSIRISILINGVYECNQ